MMAGEKSHIVNNQENIPEYLRSSNPYKSVGKIIVDVETVISDVMYEINCNKCKMCIRTLGKNIHYYFDLFNKTGCQSCGNKEFIIKAVDMSSFIHKK